MEFQETNKAQFRVEKVIKKKGINYISSRKVMITCLIAGQIPLHELNYGTEPDSLKIIVELDLSNYSTKSFTKIVPDADTSKSAKQIGLAGLKSKVDELNIDNLKAIITDLSKLNDDVDNHAINPILHGLLDGRYIPGGGKNYSPLS